MPDFSFDRITVSEISSVLCRTDMDFPVTLVYTAMPFDRLFWVESGRIRCEVPSVYPHLTCERVLLVPKNFPCRIQADTACKVWNISMILQGDVPNGPLSFPETNTSDFATLFSKMEQLRRRQSSGWKLHLFAHCYAILGAVQASVSPKRNDTAHLAERASAYLRMHFSNRKLTVEDLAARYQITRQYLRAVFSKHYGTSPSQYLQTLRIEYAKELLLTTMLPVEKVASQCGFCDIFTFSKAFKTKQGETPSAFRKNYRTGKGG